MAGEFDGAGSEVSRVVVVVGWGAVVIVGCAGGMIGAGCGATTCSKERSESPIGP